MSAKKPTIFESSYSHKIDHKDSLLLAYTAQKFIDSNFATFGSFRVGVRRENIEVITSRIFYSPDKCKLISWVVVKTIDNTDCQMKLAFAGVGMIGFRENTMQLWKVYPLENIQCGCANSQDDVLDRFGQYYFEKMKTHSQYVNKEYLDKNYGGEVRYDLMTKMKDLGYGDDQSPFILKDLGYNLQEQDFWNKSLIWQKGANIPGLYNFQTRGNVKPGDKDAEIIVPKIIYPEALVEFYR